MGCAAKIHFWIKRILTTIFAFATSLIFKEFQLGSAIRAFSIKDGVKFPVAGILTWALHVSLSFPQKE
jgi:hypothetical protein